MKKALLFLVGLVALATFAPATVSAAPAVGPKNTKIEGTVTENGNPVKNAQVTIVCDGTTLTDTTNTQGKYQVHFNNYTCVSGKAVTVTATKDSLSGTGTTTVTDTPATVNLALVNVSVPEFGVATGFLAAGIGGAAFLFVRNRQNAAA